jgi:hypothetical protein
LISDSVSSLSIVIPALNEAGHLERTVRQFQARAPENSEIVVFAGSVRWHLQIEPGSGVIQKDTLLTIWLRNAAGVPPMST